MKIIQLYTELHDWHHKLGSPLYQLPESFVVKERLAQHQYNIFLWENPDFSRLCNDFKVRFFPHRHKNIHFTISCPRKEGQCSCGIFEIVKGKVVFTGLAGNGGLGSPESFQGDEIRDATRLLTKYLRWEAVPIRVDDSGLIVTILRDKKD